jgi:hypothetical protein
VDRRKKVKTNKANRGNVADMASKISRLCVFTKRNRTDSKASVLGTADEQRRVRRDVERIDLLLK